MLQRTMCVCVCVRARARALVGRAHSSHAARVSSVHVVSQFTIIAVDSSNQIASRSPTTCLFGLVGFALIRTHVNSRKHCYVAGFKTSWRALTYCAERLMTLEPISSIWIEDAVILRYLCQS